MMPEQTMWALVNRNGWITVVLTRRTDVIDRAERLSSYRLSWRQIKRKHGLRAVKVTVREAE